MITIIATFSIELVFFPDYNEAHRLLTQLDVEKDASKLSEFKA
jgi:hypothetical protein